MNIVVFGYYWRNNIGDQEFIRAFKWLIEPKHTIVFCNEGCVKLPSNTDVVIYGGGDLLNDYFITAFKLLLTDFTGLVLGISLGVSWPSFMTVSNLKIFDKLFIRSSVDASDLQLDYIPDIVYSLPETKHVFNTPGPILKIACFLTKTSFLCRSDENYSYFLQTVVAFLEKVQANFKCEIILFPFFALTTHKNDIDLIEDILKLNNSFTFISDETKIFDILETVNITIVTKLHGHILSSIYNIPFLSLIDGDIRKTRSLVNELGVEEFSTFINYEQYTSDSLYSKFLLLLDSKTHVKQKFKKYTDTAVEKLKEFKITLNTMLNNPHNYYASITLRTDHFIYKNDMDYFAKKLTHDFLKESGVVNYYQVYENILVNKNTGIVIKKQRDLADEFISKITWRYKAEYLDGFLENLNTDKSLYLGFKWIMETEYHNK